jgi:hypothetical protein
VKVFISSVRRGLESERDALPGLLLALGHAPRRFEDYSAQPIPSREACLRGVEDADGYLLLLGEHYGEPLPDTGHSPTEEEWEVAKRRGIPMFVFRKAGITPDQRQIEFARRVEDYRAGVYRKSFASLSELLERVGDAIREYEASVSALEWRPLERPVPAPWLETRRFGAPISGSTLELHALPVNAGSALSATSMSGLPRRLARLGRDFTLFDEEDALATGHDAQSAYAERAGERTGRAGLRFYRDRRMSFWQELPRDMLGSILDPGDVALRIERFVRMAAAFGFSTDVAFAVGLTGLTSLSEGNVADLGRRGSASLGWSTGDDHVRVDAQDAVPGTSLPRAATEIAEELSARLLLAWRAR